KRGGGARARPWAPRPAPRLPAPQADEVEPRPVEQAAMLADRELAHPAKDEQLDFGQLRQVDERLDVLFAGTHLTSDFRLLTCGGHGIGTRSMTSLITRSVVSPWLAACGPSQMRWLNT